MTTKDCGAHHSHSSSCNRKISAFGQSFNHQNHALSFNVSGNRPHLTSSFKITLSSRNPNDKIGIYYDRLDVYASYGNQQITSPTAMPTTYQGHKEVKDWSPFVGGNSVHLAPYNALNLEQGTIMLMLHLDGRVRWKVGTFITGKYHLYVRCRAFINIGDSAFGVVELKVNLHCDKCIRKILKAIKKIEDIETYDVDTQLNKVTVTGNVTEEQVIRVLQ
ncbi:Heavy metal-associated domain superfamily [Arabidopsis suecica]|uniref:Heavy metal-associated domain superfamily n=1 Tax=Arabidopsis suecica TaxID=45249 RepID=A0A8T1ZB62_ARASU|nr:Heavy metal-associated domain superfamily [Arabidopsis suecica]